jgi:hypothetical protein
MIIYRTNLELQVVNPDAAAQHAQDITTNYGSYQIDVDFGYTGNQKTVTLVLAVPSSAYASIHSELLRLGIFIRESQNSRLIGAYSWEDSSYSQIRVHFRPVTYAHPRMNYTAWRSFATLQNASAVLISTLGFLNDIRIWVLVVIGPFPLAGWLIYRAI